MSRVLVTGANGLIAGHTIERLLQDGHEVVGTTRHPSNHAKSAHLEAFPGADRLSLVRADLMDADPFGTYVDVDVVMHMASPYVVSVDDPQRDLVDPAVQGTLSALEAAAGSARVRRVVLTSSVAAITDEPDGRVLTEKDWNTKSTLERNPYYYSKAEAERAAWAFMERERPGFDLVVINPFVVIGPSHTPTLNTSNAILVDLVSGTYPVVMALRWAFVDVRDVAMAHVAAMNTELATGRYLCASETLSMREVIAHLRASGFAYPALPTFRMDGAVGTAVLKLVSHTRHAGAGWYLRTHLGGITRFDNSKARRDLGVEFRGARQSIVDTMNDLVGWEHIEAL